jgi:hypothetical protein
MSKLRFTLDEAMAFDDLTTAGRAALEAQHIEIPLHERPISGKLDVVLIADYAAHPLLCLRHVRASGQSLHILCEDGTLCALLEKLYPRKPPS